MEGLTNILLADLLGYLQKREPTSEIDRIVASEAEITATDDALTRQALADDRLEAKEDDS
jgi:hypothetical protein